MSLPQRVGTGVAMVVLSLALMAQARPPVLPPDEERPLRAAIAAEPNQLENYFALAERYARVRRPDAADQVLREALKVDPGSRDIFERRVRLFIDPVDPVRLGLLANEWLAADGTNAVPVLLAVGAHMRRASRARGNGSRSAEFAIDEALTILDGALPANPDVTELVMARSNLLQARAMLVEDVPTQREAARDALLWHRQAVALKEAGATPVGGALTAAVAAMSDLPPFGPRGAVRARSGVPAPPRITGDDKVQGQARGPTPRQGVRYPVVHVELVVDFDGRVIQIHFPEPPHGDETVVAEAVKKWLYEPPVVGGRRVQMIVDAPIQVR